MVTARSALARLREELRAPRPPHRRTTIALAVPLAVVLPWLAIRAQSALPGLRLLEHATFFAANSPGRLAATAFALAAGIDVDDPFLGFAGLGVDVLVLAVFAHGVRRWWYRYRTRAPAPAPVEQRFAEALGLPWTGGFDLVPHWVLAGDFVPMPPWVVNPEPVRRPRPPGGSIASAVLLRRERDWFVPERDEHVRRLDELVPLSSPQLEQARWLWATLVAGLLPVYLGGSLWLAVVLDESGYSGGIATVVPVVSIGLAVVGLFAWVKFGGGVEFLRPHPRRLVEALLDHAPEGGERTPRWCNLLAREIDRVESNLPEPEELGRRARRGDWGERLVAFHGLRLLGEEAIPVLLGIAGDPGSSSRRWAGMLLAPHERRSRRFARTWERWVCTRCLARFEAHPLPRRPLRARPIYFGCRACKRGDEAVEAPGGIVAVLDDRMGERHRQENGVVAASWLRVDAPFDFEEVRIHRATDADVERFAIQVANEDPDPARRLGCVRVVVDPGCGLDPNTIAILERRFGAITTGS